MVILTHLLPVLALVFLQIWLENVVAQIGLFFSSLSQNTLDHLLLQKGCFSSVGTLVLPIPPVGPSSSWSLEDQLDYSVSKQDSLIYPHLQVSSQERAGVGQTCSVPQPGSTRCLSRVGRPCLRKAQRQPQYPPQPSRSRGRTQLTVTTGP